MRPERFLQASTVVSVLLVGALVFSVVKRPKASPPVERPEYVKALAEHREAITRCAKENRFPVLGFGFDVVCLDRSAVAWKHESPPELK